MSEPTSPSSGRRTVAVVLAAGKGTRMHSALPKPLHPVAGQPMLARVLSTARAAGCDRLVVVVGHDADAVRAAVEADDVDFVEQTEQRGTGDALARVEPHVEPTDLLLVLSADVPLVRAETLRALSSGAAGSDAWGAMAVATLEEPGRLGRVLTRPAPSGTAGLDAAPTLERIVEAADASPKELAVETVNAGLYALPAAEIFDHLRACTTDNAQGELYLTDALGHAVAAGRPVRLVDLDDPSEAWGINDRRQLRSAHRRLIDRAIDALEGAGVSFLDPASTTVEPEVEVGQDTVVHPGVSITGTSTIGRGCTLHQGVWLRDTKLADGAVVHPYSVLDGATVGEHAEVGPMARLRPDSRLDERARVGTFVEVKNAHFGRGAKANHLAYVGDATVGEGANLGAGVVTCNYDGLAKHRTTIGAGAFVGSDTMLVAPVTIGAGAITGAGSTITHDVPDDALSVGRAKQRTLDGWAAKRRARHAKG